MGGGILENLERILPNNIEAVVRRSSWAIPPVFQWIQRLGDIDQAEMDRVFNMGVGLVLVVSPYYADSIHQQLTDLGLDNWPNGYVREGAKAVAWE